MSDSITLPKEKTREKEEQETKRVPPFHVILFNDDDHSFDYVIGMLQKLFGYPREMGHLMAWEVHTNDKVVVLTTTKERAELKRDQIHSFGPDKSIPRCKGSMSATIEPAEG